MVMIELCGSILSSAFYVHVPNVLGRMELKSELIIIDIIFRIELTKVVTLFRTVPMQCRH